MCEQLVRIWLDVEDSLKTQGRQRAFLLDFTSFFQDPLVRIPSRAFFIAGISLCFKGFRLLSFIIVMAVFANGCMFIFAGFSRVMKFLVAISLWI